MNTTNLADKPGHQAIDCIFCRPDTASEVVIRENGFDGRQCRGCSLIFVSPRPSLGEIIDLYGHDEAYVPADSHLAAGFSKRLYARHALAILRRHRAAGDLLEIGAGGGFFLDEARKRGFNPHAIEFNDTQLRHIRDTLHIPCVASPLADDPFPGQAFDVIYHCDVVSHFYDPIAEFRTFHRAMKHDGLLVFETGNIGDMNHHYLRLFDRFQYPDHLFFYSSDNIARLLAVTGFELVAIHRYSILADLWTGRFRTRARKIARKLIARNRPAPPAAPAAAAPQPAPARRKRGLLDRLKTADQYANYLIRYRLGRCLPKGRRPQTIIVVARKSG